MKRMLSMALAAALLIASLSACGGGAENTASPTDPAGENTAAPATQPADPTQEPSLALPTEEPSDEPTEEPSSAPAAEPTDKPQEPGGQTEQNVDLAAFAQTAAESHEFGGFLQRIDAADPDTGEMMAGMLNNYYTGLTDLDLDQMEIYMSMISFGSGELALAQAKNADGANKVKEIFQARVDSKSTEGAGNYPEEVELWQRSSKVTVNGNYVMLVCSKDCDAIVSEFNELFK